MGDSFFQKLRIIKINEETSSCKTFELAAIDWKPQYVSGQFLTLVFFTEHGEKRRSYSISSSPELNEPLRITVKKIDNGEFSRQLVYEAKAGDELFCSGIAGHFVIEQSNSNHYFFLAAGSGITPCYSLIKTLLHQSEKNITLIYSNKSAADSIFLSDLMTLSEKFSDRFSLELLFSDKVSVYERRLSHWLLPQLIEKHFFKIESEAIFYLSGPFEYMQMAEITLLSRFKKDQIKKESFDHWPRLILPEPPDREKHQVKVYFNGQRFQFNVQYPVSILAQAKKEGISLPYSCEAGRCSACAGTCSTGKVWMAYNEVLTDSEVNGGRVLICQGYPIGGDVEIKIP